MKKLGVLGFLALFGSAMADDGFGAGGAIPDESGGTAGMFTSTIALPGVASINYIMMHGLTHTWCGDLRVIVTAPDSTMYSLFVRIGRAGVNSIGSPFGDSTNFGGDYMFVATGGADIWATAAGLGGTVPIPTGTYDATGEGVATPTGLFPGSYGAGDWTISAEDWAGGDTGAFTEWHINYDPVPEPASMLALGLGAAVLLRRRRK